MTKLKPVDDMGPTEKKEADDAVCVHCGSPVGFDRGSRNGTAGSTAGSTTRRSA